MKKEEVRKVSFEKVIKWMGEHYMRSNQEECEIWKEIEEVFSSQRLLPPKKYWDHDDYD